MSYNIVQDYTEHKYIEHKFTLDCKKSQSQVSIPVRENDTAIKLFITLQDGREPFYIEDGCISAIFIKKSDGTICENACIIEDNRTIRYDFTEGTANVEGINDCEVRVYSADGTMLTSPRFIMVVTNRVLSDDKITKDERTIMDKILLSELVRVNAENFREEEETVRRENEAKRVQAEEDREDIFSKKIDEINEKLAKENSLVFDTKEHLNQFIGGYESTKNLCPLPRIGSNDEYTLTHNEDGTFNFDVSHDIGEPEPFGTVTLEPGVYVFTRYNCEFYIGITFDKMIPISKPFEVTETTEYDLCSSGYAGDSFKNAWVQITKGESVPDEFIPYYAPYTREDGKTVNDLSPGDILLVSEEGVSDYWWDGNAIRPIEAQADQTYTPGSENAQSGKAVAEALYKVTNSLQAVNISYDKSNSGLESENVQDAIDEIAIKIDDMFKIESWADVQNIVNLGMAHNVFKVGEQFECSHIKYGTLIWDIVDVAPEKISLCTHKCITNLKFDIEEALYYAETELAPGTYNFTVVNQIWYPADNGKTFQFTLTKPVPQGGQIVLDMTYNDTLAGKTVYTYPSGDSIAFTNIATITQGSGGTALGKTDGSVANVNHIQRAITGSNNYKESFLRQWLNSDGAAGTFWTPQTVFDRLYKGPTYEIPIDGFINGLDADFLAVVSDTTYDVGLNNVTDGGGKETLTDKFVLLSRDEVYAGSEGGVTQGKPLPYFSEFSYNDNPSTETDNNRIKTNARGVATDWWLRSPNTIYAGSARYVSPSGTLNSNIVNRKFGVAPACNIIKKQ